MKRAKTRQLTLAEKFAFVVNHGSPSMKALTKETVKVAYDLSVRRVRRAPQKEGAA